MSLSCVEKNVSPQSLLMAKGLLADGTDKQLLNDVHFHVLQQLLLYKYLAAGGTRKRLFIGMHLRVLLRTATVAREFLANETDRRLMNCVHLYVLQQLLLLSKCLVTNYSEIADTKPTNSGA